MSNTINLRLLIAAGLAVCCSALCALPGTARGQIIYEANADNTGTIGEYDAITGAAINPSLFSGVSHPYGIVVVPEQAPGLPVSWRPAQSCVRFGAGASAHISQPPGAERRRSIVGQVTIASG
jgi:hypothetical protein